MPPLVRSALLVGLGLAIGLVPWVAGRLGPPPLPAPRIPEPRVTQVTARDGAPAQAPAPRGGPRVYYDATHGARHLWDRDNRRYRSDYHTISGWYRLLAGLRTAGYDVHAEDYGCFDRATLDAFDVFVVGEQTYHARFMTETEVEALVGWVKDGGGLLATVEHTNAHYMGDVFNRLAAEMPVKARYDSICDPDAHPSAPDWVSLPTIVPHPVTEGVRELHFHNGCSLDTEHGVALSSPTSWSDAYAPEDKPVHNGDKKRQPEELAGPLAGVAAFELGEGRVVVVADHNGLTNTELYVGDHHRFAMNAVRWLAHAEDRPELVGWSYPDGYDVLVHTGAGSAFALQQKADRGSYRTVLGFWGKEPQLRTWAHPTLRTGDEALILGAPTAAYTADELALLDQALAAGEPVIWFATLASLASPAADQLQSRYGFRVTTAPDPDLRIGRPYELYGPDAWTRGLFRVFVDKDTPRVRVDGLDPVVGLAQGAWHVEESPRPGVRIDLISAKDVGPGRFYVLAPGDLFDDRHLGHLYGEDGADVARQQTAELALRLVKLALGDPTRYAD